MKLTIYFKTGHQHLIKLNEHTIDEVTKFMIYRAMDPATRFLSVANHLINVQEIEYVVLDDDKATSQP